MAKRSDSTAGISQQDILSRLSTKARQLEGLRATDVKYLTLRRILVSAVEELPPDTRMPGIRDLADCLGISLVTVQKTITKLIAEGVLYSKPRSGVFVLDPDHAKNPPGVRATPATSGPRHPFRSVFEFGTDSVAPHQKKFWENIAGRFSEQHPNASVALQFKADFTQTDKLVDACERYDWARQGYNENLLDIAAFGGDLLPIAPITNRMVPLYYRSYFLFYNRSLLERHKLPMPGYRTFAGQSDYFRDLSPKLEAAGLSPKPYSNQEPVTLLGSPTAKFCSLFKTPEPDAAAKRELAATLDQLIDFVRLCRYSLAPRGDDGWVDARNDFLGGKSPFFFGYSVDYWEFTQRKLPFAIEAYPTLCSDDALFLWTRAGAIARDSEHPVESIHFMAYLLREEVQKQFAATGNFGADLSRNLHPQMAMEPDWVVQLLRHSVPLRLSTKEQYYLTINILGGEIWSSLLKKTSGAEVLNRALLLGQSYLRHRSAAA